MISGWTREDGRELFLIKTAGGWENRITDPARDGGRQRWLLWDAQTGFSREERRASDYDPRSRPWFKGALALERDGGLYVTPPYRFYTAQRMGVTAATLSPWREAFLDGGRAALKSRPADDRDEVIARLQAKVGQLTMDNELLGLRCQQAESGRPFVPRRRST